jgi:hypothetical protein
MNLPKADAKVSIIFGLAMGMHSFLGVIWDF